VPHLTEILGRPVALLVVLGTCVGGAVIGLPAQRVFSAAAPSSPSQPPDAETRADAAPGHRRMLALLQQIADATPATHAFLGDAQTRRARDEFSALPADAPVPVRWRATFTLAEEEQRLGHEAEAIRYYTQASQFSSQADLWLRVTGLYVLGVSYMRLGETQNCALQHSPDSCILPLRGGGIHSRQDPSRDAIATFTSLLDALPDMTLLNEAARSMHLATRWLLNIAYMTVGSYPDEVPEPYLIPPHVFESDETMPRFDNIAPHLGLDTFDLSGGAIGDDFDNDGYLDLLVSTWDTQGQMRLFRNTRDGTFSERTAQTGLLGFYGGLNMVQADYDNDGHLDVLVLRGAWLGEGGQHPNSLLRNNGDGTFTDVTFDAGLGRVHYPTQTGAWGDYDNDGDLDLYIGNEWSSAMPAPSQLFRNNGDGTFTDVAIAAGVTNDAFAKAVIWGDYDGDRWPDLYVSNGLGVNRLYRNNGDGTFTDVAASLGVTGPTTSFPAWFWDFDNDGVLDLYVAAYDADVEHLAASALGLPVEAELAHLYRGTGDGGFEEVASRYGLDRPTSAMGSNFGDLDNDGYLDFYLGTGRPPYHSLMPNVMYRNRRGTGFDDVTYSGGFGHLQKGHAVVFADFDNDGDQDVFEQMGGAFPGDRFNNALYENPGFGHHWITIQLVGVRSNRSAIGARIRAEVVEAGTRRSIYRHVNSGGSFGASPLRQTIGLGTASRIETLEVFWPTTGRTQTFTDVPVDRVLRIVEGQPSYVTIPLETLELRREPGAGHLEH